MSKLTRREKLRRYHAIYDKIYINPRIHVHEISKSLKLARNTVSSYLERMYDSEILFGPELRLKYYPELNEYMHLAKFDDPYAAFDELQRDPEVMYCSLFVGDWNLMIMCGKDYDVSGITGFEDLLFKGERLDNTTPRISLKDWKAAFQIMKGVVSEFDAEEMQETELLSNGPPPWDEEEWKLFYEYKYNFRKKVTPVLRKHLISSDKFYRWLDTLPLHTNVNLRFYPDGYENYTHFTFFFKTEFPKAVISLFSNLPTSPTCIKVRGGAIIMVDIKSDTTFPELSATIYRMRRSGMIESFNQAIGLFSYIEAEEGYAQMK